MDRLAQDLGVCVRGLLVMLAGKAAEKGNFSRG
jgi:hypothetical protein